METLILVGGFLVYSLIREWLFHKALRDMEEKRQRPLQDLAKKMMAKDLNDLRPMTEPNNIGQSDDNLLDLTDEYSLQLPKEMGVEIEGMDGKPVYKTTIKN